LGNRLIKWIFKFNIKKKRINGKKCPSIPQNKTINYIKYKQNISINKNLLN